jgi:hypothetical protein
MKEEMQSTEKEKYIEKKTNRPNRTIGPHGCSGSHND